MRNIVVSRLKSRPVEEKEVEIVERKGIGHPDTICDGLSEAASLALSRYYLKRFGEVLHHNLDKGLLVAGRAKPEFGRGRILKKIKIIIAGRATDRVGRIRIPVRRIVREAAEEWIRKNLGFSKNKIGKIFEVSVDYQSGAENLSLMFKRKNRTALANDTSFGVAHGPFSRAEDLTLRLADFINSPGLSRRFPFLGKDIKVMTLRKGERFYLTLAIAFLSKYIRSVEDYFGKKEELRREIMGFLARFKLDIARLDINSSDNPKSKDESEIYLTYTGLSAEEGDDGQVGRGNRVSGLITPFRPMSMEAAAGKNINHSGKLYQVLSFLIAREIGRTRGVEECYVKLLSEIGKPLDEPQMASIEIRAKDFSKAKERAFSICNKYFGRLKNVQKDITEGKYQLF